MKPKIHFGIYAAARLCAALPLFWLAGCRREPAPPPTQYASAAYGIEFSAPAGWRREAPSFSPETFAQYDAPADDAALYVGVNIDPIALFGGLDDAFLNFVQYLTDVYPTFVALTNTPGEIDGQAAMRFTGLLDGHAVAGACVCHGPDEYFILLNAWGGAAGEQCALLEPVLRSIRISGTQIGRDQTKKTMAELTPIASLAAARQALEFGQQLMAARDVDIGNYPRALRHFLSALVGMRPMDPRPPEYAQALDSLMLINRFRKTKLRELQVALEQALALRARAEAMRAADNIMKLYPNQDSSPYRYALRRWKAAAALPELGGDGP